MMLGSRNLRHAGSVVLLASVLVVAFACGSDDAAAPAQEDDFGALLPSDDAFTRAAKCLPAAALGASETLPPSALIPPASLPPVQAQGTPQMQGSPGSCEVWSGGYAMGSYTANLTNQQPIGNLDNTVSVGFLYPWVLNKEGMKACGGGSIVATTLNYLVANTPPSLATVPYEPSCAYLEKVDIDQPYQTDLSIGSWCYIPKLATSADTLEFIKGHLAQSEVVQISIVVPYGFGSYTSGVFNVPTACPTPSTGAQACAMHNGIACVASTKTESGCAQHGIALVGYDDTTANPVTGQPGAVVVMNSFGPTWGEQGFMTMAYQTVESIYLSATLATPPKPLDRPVPTEPFPIAILDAHQWVEHRTGEPPRTHLIVRTYFGRGWSRADVTIRGPLRVQQDNLVTDVITQHYEQPFRFGYHYITRRDGQQFPPGRYNFRVEGPRAFVTRSIDVDLAPNETLPSAQPPDDVTGTDGAPAMVTRDSFPLPQ